jgi:hypothetical protein
MAPNGSYCSWNKHCFLTSKKTVTIKRTSFCPDISTMSRSLLNKRYSLHGDQRGSCKSNLKTSPREMSDNISQTCHVTTLLNKRDLYMVPKRTGLNPWSHVLDFFLNQKKHDAQRVIQSHPKALWINFKSIRTWRLTYGESTLSHDSITISNRFTSCPKLGVMISFTSQQIKHLSEKEICQKSKMDTTIDFVKHPKYSRINIFLEHYSKNNLE